MLLVLYLFYLVSAAESSFLPTNSNYSRKHVATHHHCDESSSLRGDKFSQGVISSLVRVRTTTIAWMSPRSSSSGSDSSSKALRRNIDFATTASKITVHPHSRKLLSSSTWERWATSAALGFTLLATTLPLLVFPASSYAATMLAGQQQQATTAMTTAAALTAGTTVSLSGGSAAYDLETANNSPPVVQVVEKRAGVLDEVWRLTNRYYIDKKFNGKDWNAIRETFESQNTASTTEDDSSTAMSLARSMVSTLGDKYSRILDKESYERIQKFDLIGVGATLLGNDSRQIMVGGPPIRGSAADRAGLQAGDYIMSVNGVPTEGRNSFDIIDQVNENTPQQKTITFSVAKGGDTTNLVEVELERSFVEVNNPISYKVDIFDYAATKQQLKVGYIRIREFNSLVNTKLREALIDLESQGTNAYVLDLRSNPGGAFQSAVDVASLFIDDKVATYFVDGNAVKTPFTTSAKNVVVDKSDPVVIWLDRGSASASEVFAGAMHDNCRAIVMGDRSFGKGLIQSVFGLENGSGLVLTVAQYVTPNGSIIQGFGITPDIKATLPLMIPGLSFFASGSDTSIVNFNQVSEMLPKLCCPSSIPTATSEDV